MPTLGQIGKKLGRLAVAEGPRLFRQLQRSGALDRVQEQLAGRRPSAPSAPAGRPASTTSAPTAARARRVEYAPALDGAADPGEIVWTWVAYEEDPSQGKDRPVLLIGRHGEWLLGLPLTSKDHDRDAAQEAGQGRYWVDVGTGAWDGERRPSEARVDRIVRVNPESVRRIGDKVSPEVFAEVAAGVRAHRKS